MIFSTILATLIAQATPAAMCASPERDASVISEVKPAFPAGARLSHEVVLVRITVAADGSIGKAVIYKSSQDAALDAAGLDAATHSKYLPAVHNCAPYATEVLFRANFDRADVTPAFVPPSGWSAGNDALSWINGSETIGVWWLPAYQSLDQQMADRAQSSVTSVVLKTERERLCGKLDAYRFITRSKTGAISETVFTVSGHLTFQARYASQNGKMPGRAVEQSLLTLCPVHPS